RAFAQQRFFLLPYVSFFKVLVFYVLRGHDTNWRYVGISDVPTLFLHCFVCSASLFSVGYWDEDMWVPRGVVLIDFLMSMVLIGGARVGLRVLREKLRLLLRQEAGSIAQAIVVGAGDAGEMIIRENARDTGMRFRIRALFDDDPKKQGLTIHGIKVIGGVEQVPFYVQDNQIDMAIVAIPSANNAQMKRIHSLLRNLNITVKTLPGLNEIIHGSSKLTQLRDINISDLLGREEINIDTEQLRNLISGKTAMVTGAGGSIGSELCRQILKRDPKLLILMERTENNLFHVNRQLTEMVPHIPVIPVLCDVRDQLRVEEILQRYRPELVFHAAAHKHVPMQELNAAECFKNNVGGVRVLARACDKFQVSSFLLISTDKAVNPTSVMGASKRVCEIYCQALGSLSRTRFLSVRFGNVLASEGSVVPIFLDQIARGGPITVTHPEMRRYFMTIPEAVTLVLQATALGDSGQIMVLEMGEPIKIIDLIQHLLQLVGKSPGEISIEYVGLRPGEKLTEELIAPYESSLETTHTNIKVFNQDGGQSRETIARIEIALKRIYAGVSEQEARQMLKELVPEYHPEDYSGSAVGSPRTASSLN
ncbi:MAG: polysaccharide biosynthesis protein, partial [Desulfomonile tiedjei]|nr:polysaccharide biosynthesis protein [Desulfomonile tiedjei]